MTTNLRPYVFLTAFAAAVCLLTACKQSYDTSFKPGEAQWIGITTPDSLYRDTAGHLVLPATYLTKDFYLPKKLSQAVIYISSVGNIQCRINGRGVTDEVFGPQPTDYRKTVYMCRYDISRLLQKGNNTIEMTITNGWCKPLLEDFGMPDFGSPRAMAQIVIPDGGKTLYISTDSTWLTSNHGPIRSSNLYDGETYNALYEDSLLWTAAEILPAPAGQTRTQQMPSQEILDTITPARIWTTGNGTYMVDMGENFAGCIALKGSGVIGQPVIIRMAETLTEDGRLYTDNLRDARATNVYIPKDGTFHYRPISTYQGFRYAEISGMTAAPALNDISGYVIGNRMKRTGHFVSSDSTLNRIYEAAVKGIRGNYHDFPTDCPQRDERLGWLGDRFTGCIGESFVYDNSDLYLKWLQDIEDTQNESGLLSDIAPRYWGLRYHDNVTWTGAYIAAAEMLLSRFGKDEGIRLHYPSMRRWLLHTIETTMKDSLLTVDTYGDWCMPPEDLNLIHSKDPDRQTDAAVLSSATMYALLGKMSRFATILGRDSDAQEYNALAAGIRRAYNNEFYNCQTHGYSNNTVTANVLSLYNGLTPDGEAEAMMENIVRTVRDRHQGHVCCGVIGMQYLMRTLSRNGYADMALSMATNTSYPSWGYMLDNGATTIWELWNGNTAAPQMNSGNHVMLLGDLIIWMYEDLAGISPDSDGYRHLTMKPVFPADLTYIEASYEAVSGQIESRWQRRSTDKTNNDYNVIDWQITLPKGVSATVVLPDGSRQEIKGHQKLTFTK